MSSIGTITSVISFIKTVFDLLPKTDKIRIERAERFFYLASKIEMSVTNLILHLSSNQKKIVDFLSVAETGNDNGIKNALKNLSSIFPLPKILELPEEDVFSLTLNRITKEIREQIEKTNAIAEALKEDSENVTLLSQLWVYLGILAAGSLLNHYAQLVRFKIEVINKVLEKEVNATEIDKRVNKSVEIVRDMYKSHQRLQYEFDKKITEIEEKLKKARA